MSANDGAATVVTEILDHSSTSVTVNAYQHVMPGMAESAGAELTGLLRAGTRKLGIAPLPFG